VAVPSLGKITRCETALSEPTAATLWSSNGRLFVVGSRPDPKNRYRKELSKYLVSIDVKTGLETLLTERLNQDEVPTRLTALSDDGLAYCAKEVVVTVNSSMGSSFDDVEATELTVSPNLSHFSWTNGKGELWVSDMKGCPTGHIGNASIRSHR